MRPVVGIDLGTTNSALAYLNPAGIPEIVENAEGANMTPSVVFFDTGQAERVVVGQFAKDSIGLYDDRVFQQFKRKMADNTPYQLGGGQVTPVQLSGLVLKKLVQDGSQRIGPIEQAVITVPANFAEEARVATMDAGRAAGIQIAHIVNEPTAALFYYSYVRTVAGVVVVYDFGGGTLDVSIAEVSGGDVRIVSSKGDAHLGGMDFDKKLQELIESKFKDATGQQFDPSRHQLAKTAEEYKKQLSGRDQTNVQVTGGDVGRLVLSITRTEFEAATRTFIARADMLAESALGEASLSPDDVQEIFLVGGSSRMPMVTRHLTGAFGRPPVCHVNPDEVVALGAALYHGLKADKSLLNAAQASSVAAMKLQEVANHYFGTLILDVEHQAGPRLLVSHVIDKNTPIPCSVTESYWTVSDGQTAVNCSVTQSSTRESDPEFVRQIWKGELGPLPPNRPAGQEIIVTYSYDSNEVMHCSFRDAATGLTQEVTLGMRDSNEAGDLDIGAFLIE